MMEEKCLGDRDRQMDPLQGAHAYRKGRQQSGNPLSRVEIFPKANHGSTVSGTGCPDKDRRWLEQYVQSLGCGSLSEAQAAMLKDPSKPGLLGHPLAPELLDRLEKWLGYLR